MDTSSASNSPLRVSAASDGCSEVSIDNSASTAPTSSAATTAATTVATTNEQTNCEGSDRESQSTQDTPSADKAPVKKGGGQASKNGKKTGVKAEPESVAMENSVTSLNNLIRVAAAETLTSKPSTNPKSGSKGFMGSNTLPLSGTCITAAQSLQQSAPNVLFGQPQFTAASAQPQFFIAGPSPSHTGGMSYSQILIPINQPTQIQSNIAGNQMPAQQFITIPAPPIQILANQPIIAAANLSGLQPFAMIPNQIGSSDASSTTQQSKQLSEVTSTSGSLVPPMFLSAPNPAILSTTPLQAPTQQQQQQHNIATSISADFNNQIAKLLPSIQSLVSTSISNQRGAALSISGGEVTATNEISPPGVNETLVSSTEPGAVIDGINLDGIKDFAKQFKSRRLSMGLTQTQVGQALTLAEGPAYSQSAICRFEKLDITPKSAQKIKPVLEKWLLEAEARYHLGDSGSCGIDTSEKSKKRKRRTSFAPQAVEVLLEYFHKCSHPSGSEMTSIAKELGIDREVVRVWFCNKRQALKNAAKKIKPDTSTADLHPSSSASQD